MARSASGLFAASLFLALCVAGASRATDVTAGFSQRDISAHLRRVSMLAIAVLAQLALGPCRQG
jgi:hypothetical protein